MADATPTPASATATAPAPDWLAVAVTGADAASFLQGQLTQDLRRLAPDRPLRAALCTPQGRALALPWLLAVPVSPGADPEILLILPGELADGVATTLRRYVLRAKARIAVATTRGVTPWLGAPSDLDAAFATTDTAPAARHDADGSWLRLGPRRALRVASPNGAGPAPPPGLAPADTRVFELAAVRDGEPIVRAATREHWVPQMLNLDALDALSFAKGCYTGQEIVTRTQHRGQIKRRMLRFATSGGTLPAPGDGLLSGEAKVGEVVRAAASDAGVELLAVVSLDRAAQSLALGDGRALERLPLGYSLDVAG